MRNEIFQQIRKNRLKFISESMADQEIGFDLPHEETGSPSTFQFRNPGIMTRLVKNLNRVFEKRRKTISTGRWPKSAYDVLSKYTSSVFSKLTNYSRQLDLKADSLKMQMAEFLLILFSDEDHPIINQAAVGQMQAVSIGSGRPVGKKAKEMFFYVATKPAFCWNKIRGLNKNPDRVVSGSFFKPGSVATKINVIFEKLKSFPGNIFRKSIAMLKVRESVVLNFREMVYQLRL